MAGTDELVNGYVQRLRDAEKARADELDQVRAKLEYWAGHSLRTWLGDDVAAELSQAKYLFFPSGGSFYDVMLRVRHTWRERVTLELGIIARRANPKLRTPEVTVDLTAREIDGVSAKYYCQLSAHKIQETIVAANDWEFYVADGPAREEDLARFFLGCLHLIRKTEEAVARAESNKKNQQRLVLAGEISDARDEADLLAKYQAAVDAMPEDVDLFDTAVDNRRAELLAVADEIIKAESELAGAVEWIRTWKAARDQNLALLSPLVAELQQPIRCFSLVFAIQADGVCETRSIYVRDAEPDSDGFWIAIEGSRPYRTRVNFPVRVIEETFDFDDAPAILRNSVFVSECLFHLKFPATMDPIEVLGELTHVEFVEIPEPGDWEGYDVFRPAMDRVADELTDDDKRTLWAYHRRQYEQD